MRYSLRAENFAPRNTVAIVEHIRCEMHDALRDQIILIFAKSKSEQAQQVAEELREDRNISVAEYKQFIPFLDDHFRNRVKAFEHTTIGYGFRFNITEQNIADTPADFSFPYTLVNTFKLPAAASVDKNRVNLRRFFKVDTFGELVESTECNKIDRRAPRIAYPILGEIGLRNVVKDFVKLTSSGGKTKDAGDIRNFSEQLTFTTKLSGSINPSVELGAVANAFRLAKAQVKFSGERIDEHELTITFDATPEFDNKTLKAGRNAVVHELRNLPALEAVERGSGVVVAP